MFCVGFYIALMRVYVQNIITLLTIRAHVEISL
jgi:hypothetical protein